MLKKNLGYKMLLHTHLYKFKTHMGDYSEDQGESFLQNVVDVECRCEGRYKI